MTIPQQKRGIDNNGVADPGAPEIPYEDTGRSQRGRPEPLTELGVLERVPPHDLVAEMATLGAMLLSRDVISDVVEVLNPGDYYRPAHATIHRAILGLDAKGEPADPITVAAELARCGDLGRVGGAVYLHRCVDYALTSGSAGYYAAIVAERAVFRRLCETGVRIAGMGFAGEGNAAAVVDAAQAQLFNVVGHRALDEIRPLGATVEPLADRIQARKHAKGGLQGISTGFADVDFLTKGLRGGQFVIIAARPGVGKSTLGVDIARTCSINNKIPSVLFSLEMSREEIEERIMSAHARIPHHHLRSGEMTDDDWSRFARHYPAYESAPLFIDDSEHLSVVDIAAKARCMKRQHNIGLIVIDYIQLMKSASHNPESRQQEVSGISRDLKLLAKQLDTPVVGLSQLNRGPEQRIDKKPVISDLRESGSLEQDADVVILLHREDIYDKNSPRAGEADLIVAKHRNGPTATITVAFQGHYSRFADMARD
jgi:replicative DNA helicase